MTRPAWAEAVAPTCRGDAVAWLLARRPPRDGSTARERSSRVLAALGDPQRRLSSIHITGTNGKSSVAWWCEGLLRATGRCTGAYTSPHLVDVTERVRVDGQPVSTSALRGTLDAIAATVATVERDGSCLGFFDLLTVAALRLLVDADVDVGVVEVGRGGRDDATNVLGARVVVLGPVALDHAELGSTPAEVARTKLGLLTPGATLVTAAQPAGVSRVVERTAAEVGCRVVRVGEDVRVTDVQRTATGRRVTITTPTHRHAVALPDVGAHQADNLALAVAAVERWTDEPLPPSVVSRAARDVVLPGRMETLRTADGRRVLLDGAHNPAGAAALASALPSVLRGRRCVLVVGCAPDKDVSAIVGAVAPLVDDAVATAVPGGLDPGAVAAAVAGSGVARPHRTSSPTDALGAALDLAGPDGVVLVTGSLHLVGTVRAAVSGASGPGRRAGHPPATTTGTAAVRSVAPTDGPVLRTPSPAHAGRDDHAS